MHTETQPGKAPVKDKEKIIAGRYRVSGHLGSGAVGDVYQAVDMQTERKIAVKILKTQEEDAPDDIPERFKQEALKCIELEHPNLVKGYQYIELDHFQYGDEEYRDTAAYVMEYVEGKSAVRIMKQSYRSFQQINRIVRETLHALQYLHDNSIVHRDIKTENIYITEEGSVKLLDLGMMKDASSDILTRPGAILGTVQYMAPEYLIKKVISSGCDIYAVGIVLLELITGRRLYWGLCDNNVMQHLISTRFEIEPRVLNYLPPKYKYIVLKATAYEPGNRFGSASEMAKELDEHDEKRFKKRLKEDFGISEVIPPGKKQRAIKSWMYLLAVLLGAGSAICWYVFVR